MHPLIAQRRKDLAEICRQYRVKRLEVFGSTARGTDFDPERSDVDFLVEFETGEHSPSVFEFLDLREALAARMGRPVALVAVGSVHNPYVLAEIERSRELVYEP
jgi:predicted nucleotidyltransferase